VIIGDGGLKPDALASGTAVSRKDGGVVNSHVDLIADDFGKT